MEFMRRKIKREKESFHPCARRITKEGKASLRNRIEQMNLFNSNLPQNKFKNYTCFYCMQEGHIKNSCPTKRRDEFLYAKAGTISFRHGDEATRARIRKNKETVMCFKCRGLGHFADACSQKNAKIMQKQEKEEIAATPPLPEPKVSLKYPEFVHFKTIGILDGTDKGTWDDFWYLSNTSNKHMTANLDFFLNIKEEFLVEKLEKPKKFLFSYGIGEVMIKYGEGTYEIPGVYYTPEVTLNILSKELLRKQGFEIIWSGDRCSLVYMFKDKQGRNINIDKLREQHNTYLEDYFDMIDMSASIQREIEQPYEKEDIKTEIENFQDCVTFLDLIKEGRALNDKWETHRDRFNRITTWFFNHFLMKPLPGSLPPIIKGVTIHLFDLYALMECMGGYKSVQFEGDFEGLAEIFGLERSDGMDIKQCYLDYLEPLVSNYKAARPSIPTGGYGEEGIRRFDGYHGVGNMDGSLAAKEKVGVKHFGITLKEEKEGKNKGIAQRDDEYMARIKCYICERTGHFDSKCTMEDEIPTDEASTSRQQGEEDTQSFSSDGFHVIV
ncbi:ARID DNA-binding domain-containing protein [Tanacetum coccineum]|uniref:ARID DNA-binding domain-containing protein n=1 Tax=Tanacetum coccineum TaxID=301880 RepID=A0ABQ5I9Y9_9ASTR